MPATNYKRKRSRVPKYQTKRASFKSGVQSMLKRGYGLRSDIIKEVKAIAEMQVEKAAEKKDMGDASEVGEIIETMVGGTGNAFFCLPPIWLGTAAFQRIGSHVKAHSLKLKMSVFIDQKNDLLKYFPNGVYLDTRIFSVKGMKNGNAFQMGQSTAEFNTAIESYMYNTYYTQTDTPVLGQYKPITGEWADDFSQVNKDSITEHYKTTTFLDSSYIDTPTTTGAQLISHCSREQNRQGAFEKVIDLMPYIAKQWKYDPQPSNQFNNQAARWPNNVCLFVVTTYRNPTFSAFPPAQFVVGYIKYATAGTFSDI